MTFLASLVTITGTIMGLAAIPQAYRIFKRKSAEDISIITYSIFLIGGIIWIFYGLELNDTPIIISNIAGAFSNISVIVGWSLYNKKIKRGKR
jgi:MtN3 and saliva related transmembrane protein